MSAAGSVAAALVIGMAGQYFAGKTPVADPALLSRLGKNEETGMRLSAVAAAAGTPLHWRCKLEKVLGVEDEELQPAEDWSAQLAKLPKPAPERRAESEAYWRSRELVLELQSQHAEGGKPRLEGASVRPALDAVLAAEPELSAGRLPPDQAAFERYAKSAAKRLREVAASVPARRGWRCHDVERAQWVVENAAERLMKNQPPAR